LPVSSVAPPSGLAIAIAGGLLGLRTMTVALRLADETAGVGDRPP